MRLHDDPVLLSDILRFLNYSGGACAICTGKPARVVAHISAELTPAGELSLRVRVYAPLAEREVRWHIPTDGTRAQVEYHTLSFLLLLSVGVAWGGIDGDQYATAGYPTDWSLADGAVSGGLSDDDGTMAVER